MRISPQFKLASGLVALLLSVALIGDALGLLPRPEDQVRNARKIMGESLAVQLSSAAARGDNDAIERTLDTVVRRNEEVVFAELKLASGQPLASIGEPRDTSKNWYDFSTLDNLVVPIFKGNDEWGSVSLQFAPNKDWGMRYLGFPQASLMFIAFLGISCLATFYLFLRKALKELNPTKAVPERVTAAFEVLAEGVLILNEKQRIVLANKSFAERVHESPETLIGKSPNHYNWDLSGEGVEKLPWQIAFETGEHVMGMHLQLTTREREISFTVNAAPILDSASRGRGVLITFDDVSPLEAKNTELASMLAELNETQRVIEFKNRELETLATRDALTGALNRRSFLEISAGHFTNAREFQSDLTVLMVDIDHFKSVNDNHGHLIGDQAITLVAHALEEFFRKSDCVGRYGGEEFVVSLPGSTLEEAYKAADRLRVHIETLSQTNDLPMDSMTVSIGAATLDAKTDDLTDLLDQADRGLYKAKETGRNQVCRFDPDYVPKSQRVISPEADEGNAEHESLRNDLETMKKRVREQADEISHRSLYDDLTQLPNRMLLQDRIGQAVKQSRRTEKPGAVICISLSGYQKIFEIEGNEAAEAFIRTAAKVVQGAIRGGDSVSTLDAESALTCSRIAHNELALLAVDLEDVTAAKRVIDRVTQALEEPLKVGKHSILSRVYCGIALFPVDSEHPETLIRNATLARKFALRRSSHSSESAYFSKEIDSQALKNANIAAELHAAISNGSLQLAYQPKVDADTHTVVGVEALARWEHPELGAISPVEFIEIAETLGVIHMLTNWVLGQVCRDYHAGHLGDVRVSINVSPIELSDANTADRLLGILAAHDVPASQIGVEITESSFLKDPEIGGDILAKLRTAGVLISLDDFGTGFSSLNMLTRVPIDIIKVDRSFISDLHENPAKHCIVQAIIVMSRSLGMRMVAEGVSCDEEYECLKMLGCREMQGFHFARPMDVEQFGDYTARAGVYPRRLHAPPAAPVDRLAGLD